MFLGYILINYLATVREVADDPVRKYLVCLRPIVHFEP